MPKVLSDSFGLEDRTRLGEDSHSKLDSAKEKEGISKGLYRGTYHTEWGRLPSGGERFTEKMFSPMRLTAGEGLVCIVR